MHNNADGPRDATVELHDFAAVQNWETEWPKERTLEHLSSGALPQAR